MVSKAVSFFLLVFGFLFLYKLKNSFISVTREKTQKNKKNF